MKRHELSGMGSERDVRPSFACHWAIAFAFYLVDVVLNATIEYGDLTGGGDGEQTANTIVTMYDLCAFPVMREILFGIDPQQCASAATSLCVHPFSIAARIYVFVSEWAVWHPLQTIPVAAASFTGIHSAYDYPRSCSAGKFGETRLSLVAIRRETENFYCAQHYLGAGLSLNELWNLDGYRTISCTHKLCTFKTAFTNRTLGLKAVTLDS